ncbi:hypothetical protein QBC43DRAFT_348953 [Cladorrhinum sp. PSN259]|nr:hypothetical protein QBC43DRAFT_348953 [Cladorrhinum sp. PSN259]
MAGNHVVNINAGFGQRANLEITIRGSSWYFAVSVIIGAATIMCALFADWIMVVCGLVGALISMRLKWGFWTFGTAAFLFVVWQILFDGRRYAAPWRINSEGVFVWRNIDPADLGLLLGHRNIDPADLGLDIRDPMERRHGLNGNGVHPLPMRQFNAGHCDVTTDNSPQGEQVFGVRCDTYKRQKWHDHGLG